jgi:hypothetical protein
MDGLYPVTDVSVGAIMVLFAYRLIVPYLEEVMVI